MVQTLQRARGPNVGESVAERPRWPAKPYALCERERHLLLTWVVPRYLRVVKAAVPNLKWATLKRAILGEPIWRTQHGRLIRALRVAREAARAERRAQRELD